MSGRVCVVAGAGPGVGLAVARRFAREGFTVVLNARRQAALDEMVAAIAADGGDARSVVADLTDLGALRAALDRIAAETGAPSVLVWNGGRGAAGRRALGRLRRPAAPPPACPRCRRPPLSSSPRS